MIEHIARQEEKLMFESIDGAIDRGGGRDDATRERQSLVEQAGRGTSNPIQKELRFSNGCAHT